MKLASKNLQVLIALITGLLITAVSASFSPEQPAQNSIFLGIMASIFSWIGLNLNSKPKDPYKELIYNALMPAQLAQLRELLEETRGTLPENLSSKLEQSVNKMDSKGYLKDNFIGEDLREVACLFSAERIVRLLLPTSLLSVKLATSPKQEEFKKRAILLASTQINALEEVLDALETLEKDKILD